MRDDRHLNDGVDDFNIDDIDDIIGIVDFAEIESGIEKADSDVYLDIDIASLIESETPGSLAVIKDKPDSIVPIYDKADSIVPVYEKPKSIATIPPKDIVIEVVPESKKFHDVDIAALAKSDNLRSSSKIPRPDEFYTFDIPVEARKTQNTQNTQNTRAPVEYDTDRHDFEVNFDFESEYRDMPEDNPLRIRREKRTGLIGGLLYAAAVISVSLVLASLMWMAASDVLGFGTPDEIVSVTIPKEFTIDDVAEMLFDAQLIKYKSLFLIYADYSEAEEKIVPGSYMLNRNHDYRSLVYGMTARSGIRVETTVTLPEGLTLAEIFTRLEDYGIAPAEDLWEAAANHHFDYPFLSRSTLGDRYRLEGFLFPETYNFYLDSQPTQVISRMLSQFNTIFSEEFTERTNDMGYTINEIVTIASMIEREAGNDDERPRIAAVIYNRLNDWDNPILQIDATLLYAAVRLGRPPGIDTEIESPYNTYTNPGLPPGPIATPGLASLQAALYPEDTNEYYYALNIEGTHDFFRTYDQHQAFVRSDRFGGN